MEPQVIYLDDHERPVPEKDATRVRILDEEEGDRIEVYGVIEPPKASS